jgi:hypothetical protein
MVAQEQGAIRAERNTSQRRDEFFHTTSHIGLKMWSW